jgi:preprotein translocase subunit SecE
MVRWDLIVTAVVLAALAGLGYWLWSAGHWGSGLQFVRETNTEMKKVSFPSRDEVVATTIICIVTSFIFAVYLWGVDPQGLRVDRQQAVSRNGHG